MSEYAITVENVTKKFNETIVLNNISLSFEKGKIHGIIGRNGSGKTVLFKCIVGFMPVSSGVITVNGRKIGTGVKVASDMGIIIEAPGFLPHYSGYKNLKLLAKIRNMISKEDIFSAMATVGLDPKSKKHVGKYSLGMRQRLGIAQAIMEDPSILLLDEPMNGLDNQGVEDMRKLFMDLREQGKTILIASHSREDINILCDTVHEMHAGILDHIM